MKTMKIEQNLKSGRYCVYMDGWRSWDMTYFIGDGITSAASALVTRTKTMKEAKIIANRLNDNQPDLLPGSGENPMFGAKMYDRRNFICSQDRLTFGGFAENCRRLYSLG